MVGVAPTRDRTAADGDGTAAPLAPPGRRASRPRWRDGRLLVGLLLVLLSVLLGARVVASADRSAPWLAAAGDLPAGHVLTDGDLRVVRAHLQSPVSVRYFGSGSRAALIGRSLVRPVGAGNLLPQDALAYGPVDPTRVVPVIVSAGRLPALGPGDHVDVYVLSKAAGGGADRELLVVAGAEYLAGETLGNGDTSASLRVPVPDAIRVVAASQSGRVDLVRVDGSPPLGGRSATAPTEAPGFGG